MKIQHPIVYQNELMREALKHAGSAKELARIMGFTKNYSYKLQRDRMASGTLMIRLFDFCEICEVSGREIAIEKMKK